MIMLDTTACIDFLTGEQKLKQIIDNSDKILYITSISIYEISIGLERTKRMKSKNRYTTLYKKWIAFLSGLNILTINLKEAECAARIYDQLNASGELIDDNDILIAGTMLANKVTKIVTRNARHFERIEGIEVITY
ncbi:MAG: type II toxin-antitoxin system VapC family toxin [Candidatus Helarchaeota archaeon]